MSKRRQRGFHINLSSRISNNSQRSTHSRDYPNFLTSRPTHTAEKTKKDFMGNSTTYSIFLNQKLNDEERSIRKKQAIYNRNIAKYRGSFNQNDISQLPFMSSLRENQLIIRPKTSQPRSSTICVPYQAALKGTANQIIKKNVNDFSAKQSRLTSSFYRWHNKSGKNNKWVVDFECSLRDYGSQQVNAFKQKIFQNNSLIRPISYRDVQQSYYDKNELICPKSNRSFKIK